MIAFLQTKHVNIVGIDSSKLEIDGPWQHQIIQYLEEQGGSYQDKKWQMDYFEEFKVIGLGKSDNAKM